MSYYRYEYQRDTYSYPRHNHGYGGGGYGGGRPSRDYEEPRRHGYASYSNRSGLGGMGNPFSGMGDRMMGGVRGVRGRINAELDEIGSWGRAMDDRFDRFSGGFRRGFGQRMSNGFGRFRSGGGGGNGSAGAGVGPGARGGWRYA